VRNSNLTVIDLFAGAGGFSLAALNLRMDVRATVECDAQACETYRESLVERLGVPIALICEDITKIRWARLLEAADLLPRQCDLLLGGPPCQGFSTHRIKGAGINDPRNDLGDSTKHLL
jgi:DNA (cytosine-5)-methyltransferase 1